MKLCQVRPTEMLTNKYRFIKSQLKNYWFWQSDYADAWSWSRHLCKEHMPALLLLGSPAGCSLPAGPVSCSGVYNRSFLFKHRACKSLVKLWSAWLCSNNISSYLHGNYCSILFLTEIEPFSFFLLILQVGFEQWNCGIQKASLRPQERETLPAKYRCKAQLLLQEFCRSLLCFSTWC